jgi:competence protein ComEA
MSSSTARPPLLLVLLIVAFVTSLLWRELSTSEALPLSVAQDAPGVVVELSGIRGESGVRQLSDGSTIEDVIRLTGLPVAEALRRTPVLLAPLVSGEDIQLSELKGEIRSLKRSWMPASHRMALAIPLHPDRMGLNDWPSLPGIGEVLAARIEADRQKNGDFGTLDGVRRVKGIGRKRIERWRKFF